MSEVVWLKPPEIDTSIDDAIRKANTDIMTEVLGDFVRVMVVPRKPGIEHRLPVTRCYPQKRDEQ